MLTWLAELSGESIEVLKELLNWPGPQNYDTWGILANYVAFAIVKISGGLPVLLKVVPMTLHTINALLVFKLTQKTLETIPGLYGHKQIAWLPLITSLLFVSNPLAPEAVAYFGGVGYNLGCTLLLIAFLLYLKGKTSLSWTYLGLGWILFLLAIICDRSLWSAGFGIVAYELAKSHIGEAALHKKESVPEKHVDAIDDMLEDVERHYHEHKRSEAASAQEAEVVSPEAEVSDTVHGTTMAAPDDIGISTTESQNTGTGSDAQPAVIHPDSHLILFDSLVPALPFVILGSLIPLGALPQAGNEPFSKEVIITSEDYMRVLGGMFLPINGTLSPEQAARVVLTTVLSIGGLFVPFALGGSRRYRQNFAFLSGWLLLLIVPHLHGALSGHTLNGSRLLYNTLLPACALETLVIFAPVFALYYFAGGQRPVSKLAEKPAAIIVTLTLATAVYFQFGALSWQQNVSYRSSAETLKTIQDEIKSHSKRSQAEFILSAGIPHSVSIAPVIAPSSVCMFDSETALLRAPRIPTGVLREQVKDGNHKVFNIDANNSLRLFDPAVLKAPAAPPLNADALLRTISDATRNNPKLDAANGALRLETDTGGSCPTLTLNNNGKLLCDDFIYVDAKIWPEIELSKEEGEKQWIELCWSTESGGVQADSLSSQAACKFAGNYVRTRATFKDDRFHRYYFPVRASGWLASDRISELRLRFPARSMAWVKEIGTTDGAQRLPRIALTQPADQSSSNIEKVPSSTKRYSCLCFDYPQMSELGTIAVYGNRAKVAIDYDASHLSKELGDIAGCMCEINEPGKWFDNPNGEEFQTKVLKTIDLEKIAGRIILTASELKRPGIYSIRIFARDAKGAPVGNASDEVICLFDSNARP